MNVERKKKDARWCNATSRKEASPSRRVNETSSAKSAFTEEAGGEQLLCRFLFRGLWKKHQSLFSTHQEQWPLLGDIVTSTYSFILIITIFWKPVIHTKLSQNQLCMQNVSLLIFFKAFCLTFNWITPTGRKKAGLKITGPSLVAAGCSPTNRCEIRGFSEFVSRVTCGHLQPSLTLLHCLRLEQMNKTYFT